MNESSDIEYNCKEMKCAPTIKKFQNFDGTCFRTKDMIEILEKYNLKNPQNKIEIPYKLRMINEGKFRKNIIKKIKKNILIDKLQTEINEILEKKQINVDGDTKMWLKKYTFLPKGPKTQFSWLSNFNILDVFEQYMKIYPEFLSWCVPIDFDLPQVSNIGQLNFDDLVNAGKTKLGFVFNLDTHDKSGSHWVSLYVDLLKGEIYFFDSVGKPPVKEIRDLNKRFCIYFKNKKINYVMEYNKFVHQKKNTECGVYSINFILQMLMGKKFYDIVSNPINDEIMNKNRDLYFL